MHYIELWADKKPVLHKISLGLYHPETEPTRRAAAIIQNNNSAIIAAANEFSVDPVIVGSVVFEEQSTNVNFIDTLTDYVGGLLHINTSIGIGQVRIKTAALLENKFPELNPLIRLKDPFADSNIVRVERLKDPLTNLRYVAAKIKFDIDRWNAAGYSINDKVDILGTLYNIEEIDHPVVPHPSPEPNNFGVGTQNNYDRVKKLLGL
jgi:hypothetical protein